MKNFLLISEFIDTWTKPKGTRRFISLGIILSLQLIAAMVVYVTGGTRNVYLHIMYFPLFLGCISNGLGGGIFYAITGGLFLGPLMPINVATGEMQLLQNWLIRIVFFLIIGVFTGIVAEVIVKQLKYLNKIGFYHPLTELKNRKYFENIELNLKEDYYLMLLNIENYSKALNNLGYSFVNNIMVEFSNIMKDASEELEESEIFQFSDNQFAILIPHGNDTRVFSKLSSLLRRTIKLEEVEFYPEISLGVARYDRSNMDLIKKAEMARSFARKNLLDFYLFIPEVSVIDVNNFELFSEIPRALREKEFYLTFQPKIDLRTMKVVSAEALIRWNHPEKGIVRPDEFIPYIETTNFINKITQWVLKESFKINNLFERNGINIEVSINIPLKHLRNPGFMRSLRGLKALGIPLNKLEVEVLERDLVDDFNELSQAMLEIKELGIAFSLDDFGTGYSSISYIKKLPFDKIKIDKMFVLDIDTNPINRDIVKNSIELAHLMGNEVVCEGVESGEVIGILKELSCDYAQGYSIAKPLIARDFISWYKEVYN